MVSQQHEKEPQATTRNQESRRNEGFGPGGGFFEIRVRGHLDSKWADWLEKLEVELLENGEMVLSGDIVDQAALMGVLNRLYRLNLALLSVNEVRAGDRREDRNE